MYQQREVVMGGYQGAGRPQMSMNMGRGDPEIISLHSMRPQSAHVNSWMADGSDAGSMVSERDATLSRQYTHSVSNGYNSQMRQTVQGSGAAYQAPMRRSLSGTLSRGASMTGGGEPEMVQQSHSYKGPAYRTISRINNRNRTSMGSVSGASTLQHQMSSGSSYMGGGQDRGFVLGGMAGSQGNLMMMQRPGTMSRAMSMKSMHSVGRGMDVYDGAMDSRGSLGNLSG